MKKFVIILFLSVFTQFVFAHTDTLTETKASRNFTFYPDKIEVTISIYKPAKGGFARIYEKLPSGASIKNVKCGAGYYKADKSMLKVVWDDIPDDTSLLVSYTLKLTEKLTDTIAEFQGTFSAEFMTFNHEQINIENGNKSYAKEVLLATENDAFNTTPEKTKTKNSTENISPSTHSVTTSTDTYICIQVAAVGSNVSKDYLLQKFGYPGEFESHFEENFYRITVGKYHSISEAQTALNELKAKYFSKCFLSAYKDGHKIPVYKAENILN